ncbi:hypothetical protein ACFQ0B_65635 [Nonomuraea thailandensis]
MAHVAAALHDALPLPYPRAAALVRECAATLDMWSGWPATEHTALQGLDHLEPAMETLAALTPYATGEFAVRPYLDRYRDDAIKIMYGWAESPDEHLRRLASEGSRPRLPWAGRVGWLMTPGPTLPCSTGCATTRASTSAARSPTTSTTWPRTIRRWRWSCWRGGARAAVPTWSGCCATRSAGCCGPATLRPSPCWAPRRAAARWRS